MTHNLKIESKFYNEVIAGTKNFELRKNDRNFKIGDIIHLIEYHNSKPTSRTCKRLILYILKSSPDFGLMSGYSILSFNPLITNF